MAPPQGKKQVKLNAVMFSIMLEDLLRGPCTAQEIADSSGMALLTTQKTLRAMYRRGVVHISGWELDAAGRCTVRVFALGEGKDARKPIKRRSELNRKYRANRVMREAQTAFSSQLA
jgi:hypothetical protein